MLTVVLELAEQISHKPHLKIPSSYTGFWKPNKTTDRHLSYNGTLLIMNLACTHGVSA